MITFLKNNWQLLLIIILSLLTAWPLFLPGYFSHHDDLQVIRIFEMRKCFADLQIPCRWVPDMGYGNGFPLFNYYSATPYYFGAILSYVVGYIGAAKAIFIISFIMGAVGMYLLTKKLFGKSPALAASILFIYVPYRALDVYVRGALAEIIALSTIPFIFYFALKRSFVGLVLSLFVLLTTHNIMTLLFLPIFLIWVGYQLVKEHFRGLRFFFASLVLAIGLSAFFLIPAYFEKDLVTVETLTQGQLDYRVHFVAVRQFLVSDWGYGASREGTGDGLSFQIGWIHILIVFVSVVALFIKTLKANKNYWLLVFFLLGLVTLSLFMAHGKSWFVWEKITILKYVQFPWRFLAITSFSISLLGGILVYLVKPPWQKYLAVAIVALTILINFAYFRPEKIYRDLTDNQKLSGTLWEEQQKGGILDYLPESASEPSEPAPVLPIVKNGEGEVRRFINKSNRWELSIKVLKDSTIEVPVFDFPTWQVRVGERVIPHQAGAIGRITFQLPIGEYKVEGKLKNTLVRTLANTLSGASILFLICYAIYGKSKQSLAK